jgi:hypothetical protein
MHRQQKVKTFLAILVALVWFSTASLAQDPDPDPDPAPLFGSQTIDDPTLTNNSDPIVTNNGIDPGGDPGIPVDGGLSLLLAAGAAFGARKLKRKSYPKFETGKGD